MPFEFELTNTAAKSRPVVLYLHNGTDLYGASRSLLRLVTSPSPFVHHVIVPAEGPLTDAMREAAVPFTVQPSLAVLAREVGGVAAKAAFAKKMMLSGRDIAAEARRVGADLIHTNVGTIASAGLGSMLAGLPHVWHIRDSFRDFPALWKLYSQYILMASTQVICVSRSVAEQFPEGHPKISVIHNGLPLDEFAPVTPERISAFRKKFHLDGCRLVGLVGRIKLQRKGQDFLLRAANELRHQPDLRFVFVGSPFPGNEGHLETLRAMVQDLNLADKVVMTGDVDDIKAAIASLDVMVMASCEAEPFAGVVLEAMALGVPVVGTHIGGTIEQVEDGASGLLVKPNDVVGLAAAIRAVIEDPLRRDALVAAGRKRVVQYFTFDRMQAQIYALYRGCLPLQCSEHVASETPQ